MLKILCPGCGKTYSCDSSKIPSGKSIEIPCPSCKKAMTVTIDSNGNPATGQGEALFKTIIKESKALPPMPKILEKATKILSDENAGFKEIGNVLETDQAMATRILKLANSAYYALSIPVESVQQASALLGYQTLLELITVVSTSRMMGKNLSGYGIDSGEMWKHSLSVANAAKIIAGRKFPELVGNAFNAGLIHDSGMIILDEHIAKRKDAFKSEQKNGSPIHEIEKKILGFDHAEIASEFFKKWNLPLSQTRAIRYHHDPEGSEEDTLSFILHAADSIVTSEEPGRNSQINENAVRFLGLDKDAMQEIYDETMSIVSEIINTIES